MKQEIKGPFGSYTVEIVPGKSIRILANQNGRGPTDVTFNVGDTCTHDSYNLIYLGTILNITEKTVTIQPKHGDSKRRLKLVEFCWRNYAFDLAKVTKQNHETSMCI